MNRLKFNNWLPDIVMIGCLVLGITLLVWLPHIWQLPNFWGLNFSNGFNTIYRNYDGLEYVVIAKSLYLPHLISQLPNTLSPNYYAAHFPGYSLAILALAPLVGFLKSMLLTSLIFTFLATVSFYILIRDFKLSNHPLWLSFLFNILPARWLIVHSVGSAEPMFIFFTILAFYFLLKFERQRQFLFMILSAVMAMLAQLTRPPGALIFVAIGIYLIWQIIQAKSYLKPVQLIKTVLTYSPFLLIPLALIGIFAYYGYAYQDFWAYFHSGDNIHLSFPPFQVFNKAQPWVGDIWLEDIIYTLLLGFLGGVYLLKQKMYPIGIFVLTYLTASSLVAHRDISRYVLPVFPFVLIAFEKVLVSREFKIAMIIITMGIYLYSQNFILENTAPIPNLGVFN